MKIIIRKDAKSLGLNKYYTGKACKNGHVSERYVASGTCQDCINGTGRALAGDDSSPETVLDARNSLVCGRFRVWNVDARKFERYVIDFGHARYPGVPETMFRGKKGPTKMDGDNGMYEVWFHPDDLPLIEMVRDALRKKHMITDAGLQEAIARSRSGLAQFVQTKIKEEENAAYDWDNISTK